MNTLIFAAQVSMERREKAGSLIKGHLSLTEHLAWSTLGWLRQH